jgi:RinA family phage transcriptional activator
MKRTDQQWANRKVIEVELRNYKKSVRDIRNMRDDILECGYGASKDTGEAMRISTEKRAIRLMTSPALKELERRVEAIKYMIDFLEAQEEQGKIKFLRMKYFDNQFTDFGICQQLNISRPTYFRWREQIISLVAERLGFEV